MWNQKEVRREPLPDGTVLCTENGRFTIQKYITSGGFALLYQAQEEGQMYPVILKEYFPRQGYVRVDGAVLPEEAAALPENDPEREKRIETMRTLFEERADREIRVGQQSRQRTRLTVPVDRKLSVRSIQLPGKDPCTPPYSCILEMECLTERQGFWLKDLLEEAAQPCSPGSSFRQRTGRAAGNSVPQFAKTVDLFCALLANLKRIHSDEDGSGCIHGDISAGNLFVDGSLSNGTILGVSLLDFGGGWDEETRPESDVFSTPGFRAPELKNGGTPTPASDVYAVGRLFYALLDPTAANNLRLGRDLSFLERYVTLTASQARPSGLEGSLLAQVNALLTAAAKEAPEERITLEEMARQMDEWRRRLTPPVWSLAQNAGALNDGEVRGRDEDVKNLLNELENEKRNPHVLWGFAGMGKTKLALAAAGEWQKRHPLGRTYFVRFPGTLEALYTDTFAHAMPVERGGPDLIEDVQKLLCENLSELDLLVIDNFDRDEASSWAELTGASGSLEQQLYQQLCALPLPPAADHAAESGTCGGRALFRDQLPEGRRPAGHPAGRLPGAAGLGRRHPPTYPPAGGAPHHDRHHGGRPDAVHPHPGRADRRGPEQGPNPPGQQSGNAHPQRKGRREPQRYRAAEPDHPVRAGEADPADADPAAPRHVHRGERALAGAVPQRLRPAAGRQGFPRAGGPALPEQHGQRERRVPCPPHPHPQGVQPAGAGG